MIISQTPYRVSLFGGGTDFPEYFNQHGGAVLGFTIDKYIYHHVTKFPSYLFDYSIRIAYSRVETVRRLNEIEHSPFREIMRTCGVDKDIEIGITADLPSFSGLGSSSSFTTGLIKSIKAHQGVHIGKEALAKLAIHVERDVLLECVGFQDQVFAAYGGFNLIEFSAGDQFEVHKLVANKSFIEEMNKSLMLFYTGIKRKAHDVEQSKLKNYNNNLSTLCEMRKKVDEAYEIINTTRSVSDIGRLLKESWECKRTLSSQVSNEEIDRIYQTAIDCGAFGGKLLGAGGGGFMFFLVPPENQQRLRLALKHLHEVQITMSNSGSMIIHDS